MVSFFIVLVTDGEHARYYLMAILIKKIYLKDQKNNLDLFNIIANTSFS